MSLSPGPRVVAVMVTGKHPERRRLALASLAAWRRQDYQNRGLVIVNDGEPLLSTEEVLVERRVADLSIRATSEAAQEHLLPRDESRTLGDLRNIGQAAAYEHFGADSFIIQWDDDDFSHPSRISEQVAAWRSALAPPWAVLCRYAIHCELPERPGTDPVAFVRDGSISRVHGLAGTMLYGPTRQQFPALRKHEDTEFLLAGARINGRLVAIKNEPRLYLRLFHGANTWQREHVMRRSPGSRELTSEERGYVCTVLAEHYGEPAAT